MKSKSKSKLVFNFKSIKGEEMRRRERGIASAGVCKKKKKRERGCVGVHHENLR